MKAKSSLIVLLLALSVLAGCAGETYVASAPPSLLVEVRPPRPMGAAIWIDGHWAWDGYTYNWVPGYWEPHPHGEWVPGQWEYRDRGYRWMRGYWNHESHRRDRDGRRWNDRDGDRDRDRDQDRH